MFLTCMNPSCNVSGGRPTERLVEVRPGVFWCRECAELEQNRAMRNNEYKPINPCCENWGDTRLPYDL